MQVLIGNGAGAFTNGLGYVSSALYPQGVTTADFNHDGYLDVAVSYVSGAGLRILYGNGGTAFTARAVKGDTYLNVLEAGDFDGDGWIDLAAASTARSTLTIYHGTAAGFVFAQRLVVGSPPRGIAVGDLNQDGILDLLLPPAGRRARSVCCLATLAILEISLPEIEFPAGAGSRDAVIADFDGDGRLDIASANELAPSATVLSKRHRLRAGRVRIQAHDDQRRWNTHSVRSVAGRLQPRRSARRSGGGKRGPDHWCCSTGVPLSCCPSQDFCTTCWSWTSMETATQTSWTPLQGRRINKALTGRRPRWVRWRADHRPHMADKRVCHRGHEPRLE